MVWAIELGSAKQTALIVAGALVVFALVSVWLIKQVVSKLLTVAVLGGLALVVWTQRASLDDCANGVMDSLRAGAVDDTTCTFFGRDVTIRSPLGSLSGLGRSATPPALSSELGRPLRSLPHPAGASGGV